MDNISNFNPQVCYKTPLSLSLKSGPEKSCEIELSSWDNVEIENIRILDVQEDGLEKTIFPNEFCCNKNGGVASIPFEKNIPKLLGGNDDPFKFYFTGKGRLEIKYLVNGNPFELLMPYDNCSVSKNFN